MSALISYIRNIFSSPHDNPYIPIINDINELTIQPLSCETPVLVVREQREQTMHNIIRSMYMWVFHMEQYKEIKIDKLHERKYGNYDMVRYVEYLKPEVSYFDILSIAATCKSAYSEWNKYRLKLLRILRNVVILINIDNVTPLKFKIEISHYINHVHCKSYETSNDGKGSYGGDYIRSGIVCWSISGIYSHESKSFRTYEDVSRVKTLFDDLYAGKKGILKRIYDYHKKPGLDIKHYRDNVSQEWPFAKLPDLKTKKTP